MDIICIKCPRGCHLHIEKNNNIVTVTGNSCPRGAEYGKQEITAPMRPLTTVVMTKKGTISLRTTKDIPKKYYFKVLNTIKNTPLKENYKTGDIFISNICNTKSDIIVTNFNDISKI